jgi:hypothetical protein
MKTSKRNFITLIAAVGMALIVAVGAVCGVFFSNNGDLAGDSSLSSDSKISAVSTPITTQTGSNRTFYASVVNLNSDGTEPSGLSYSKFYNNLMGYQEDYVYIGTNPTDSSGLTGVKWRVLTKDDKKYSDSTKNGKVLLWADDSIGTAAYNLSYYNLNSSFWGKSYVRALLNEVGTTYISNLAGTANITNHSRSISNAKATASTSSFYAQVFKKAEEQTDVINAGTYSTLQTRDNNTYPGRACFIASAKSSATTGESGYYYTSEISAMNSFMTANSTATLTSSVAVGSLNTTLETSSGDKMFLLDYFDINNLAYGMGDDKVYTLNTSTNEYELTSATMYADKTLTAYKAAAKTAAVTSGTYADAVLNLYNGEYSVESDSDDSSPHTHTVDLSTTTIRGIPWRGYGQSGTDGTNSYNNISVSYLSSGMLRNCVNVNTYNTQFYSRVLAVGGCVYMSNINSSYNIRPAFCFDPSNVIYATAGTVPSYEKLGDVTSLRTVGGTTDTKPGYKLYLKSANFENYNSTGNAKATAKVTRAKDSNGDMKYYLNITNTKQAGKKVTALLVGKDSTSSTKGAVDYMGSATLDGATGVAKIEIPSDTNIANYNIVTLYSDTLSTESDSTSLLTETVNASYVILTGTDTTVTNPTDYEMTYIGDAFTETTAFVGSPWYSVSDYTVQSGNTDPNVSVEFTVKTSGLTLDSNGYPYLVGEYYAKFTLNNGKTWSDGSYDPITVVFTIEKRPLSVRIDTGQNTSTKLDVTITDGITTADAQAPPTVTLWYENTSYSSATPPSTRGVYTVTVKMADDGNTINNNYMIDDTSYTAQSYTKEADAVTKPEIWEDSSTPSHKNSYTYQGKNNYYNFIVAKLNEINGVASTTAAVAVKVEFTPYAVASGSITTSTVTTTAYDTSTGGLKFALAGKYVVTFSLANGGKGVDDCPYVWDDVAHSIDSYSITIEVTQKSPMLTIGPAGFEANWQLDKKKTITVESSDIDTGDTIYIVLSFTPTGTDGTQKSQTIEMLQDSSGTIAKMVATWADVQLAYGTYNATATIDQTKGDFANYSATSVTYSNNGTSDINVTAKNVSGYTLNWKYTDDGTNYGTYSGTNTAATSVVVGSYQNLAYTFSVDTDALKADGIVLDGGFTYNTLSSNADNNHTNAGNYSVTIKLKQDPNNTQVSFKGDTCTLYFTIAPLQFDISNVKWDYTSFTYNGNAKTVNITGLDKVVAYDAVAKSTSSLSPTSALTANVTGNSATNAGSYTASVAFACTDTNFEAPVATATGGTQNYVYSSGSDTEFAFSLDWKIAKAKLDLSNAKWNWQIANFKFNGQTQTVALYLYSTTLIGDEKTAMLPEGLIPEYDGVLSGKDTSAGGKATVTFKLSTDSYTNEDKTSGTYEQNYLLPQEDDKDSYIGSESFVWALNWTIGKAEIEAEWTTYEVTDVNGNSYYIAVLSDDNGQPMLDKTLDPNSTSLVKYTYYKEEACENEITFSEIEVDVNSSTKYYYAKVEVNEDNDEVYTIVGKTVKIFEVGTNKTKVSLTVTGNIYNTQPQAANISISVKNSVSSNTVTLDDLIVDYYATKDDRAAKVNELKSLPINAGDYYLSIALNTTKSDEFIIIGATTFTYTIAKKQLDVTNITWNYDAANPYEYTLKGGVEQVYEVKLTGYTDSELDNMFVYSDNTGSSVYSYTKTMYKISMTDDERANYELISYDSAGVATVLTDADVYKICPQSLSWEIIARQLVRPTDSTITFDDLEHSLLTLCGIDVNSDWGEYMTLTVTKDGEAYEDASGNINTVAHYAGTYTLTFAFTPAAATNAGWAKGDGTVDHYNVTVNCVVDKLTLTLTGWKNNPPEPKFDGTVGSNFYQVVYEKVSDGTRMDRATALTCEGEACIAYVEPATGLEDSVVVAAQSPMIPLQKAYKYSSSEPEYLVKPTLKAEVQELSYTGSEINIADYLEGFDADKMTLSGDIKVVNAGEYSVIIGINDSLNAYWQGEDNWDAFSLTFSVAKRIIKINWDTSGKIPVLTLPDGNVQVDYTYYDKAQESEIGTENMVNDGEYIVVANLTDDAAVNNILEDDSTQIPEFTDSASDEFVYVYHTFLNLGFLEVDPDFPCLQLVIILFCLLVTIICFIKGSHNLKAARKVQNDAAEKFTADGDGQGDSNNYSSCGLMVGGSALLASGGSSMLFTIIAAVAIGIMLIGVIFLIVSTKKQGSAQKEAKKAEKEFNKKQAEEKKVKQEAERQQREKEAREEEKRVAKEEREAERVRQEKADEQKQMMMMMMMKGGSSSSGGGGSGGGTTAIPYPVPTYSAPPPQTPPAPAASGTDDVVAKVLAAIQPTLQAQQQQMTQQQVKSLEDKIVMQSQQLNQHQQEDKIKALEDELAKHKQEQQSLQQDGKLKSLEEQFDLQMQQLIEQQKLAEQQFKESKQDVEHDQSLANYMLNRSELSANEEEDRKRQQLQAQINALDEQIKLQKQLIDQMRAEQMRVSQPEQPTAASDKDSLLLELLQKSLKELSDRQTDDRTKLFEETLKKQEQLIEELREKNANVSNANGNSCTVEQLQLMLQKQLEQERQERENKFAKQQAEFEQKRQELAQKLYEQQVQRQQELQALQQDQSRQQIKALEEQLAQQKAEQAKQQEQQEKLLEQQKLEQEKLLEQQRQEQEKKLEELKNQKDQAELLAELRSQREPAKQDDNTSKILEEHSKTLEQIAKQQAEMQVRQQEQEQERLRQEQERQRKELEQKVQDQADQIKELQAKHLAEQNAKQQELIEQQARQLAQQQNQADLQAQEQARQLAQRLEQLQQEQQVQQASIVAQMQNELKKENLTKK